MGIKKWSEFFKIQKTLSKISCYNFKNRLSEEYLKNNNNLKHDKIIERRQLVWKNLKILYLRSIEKVQIYITKFEVHSKNMIVRYTDILWYL